ncbi:MAG: flap endonuclease [Gammaproteobacteria bacterium]|nr:flap endonuclease [Gammaproteobacteria bacterium]
MVMSATALKTQSSPATVYLIDASIYIFQAHFSPYVEYTNRHGNELGALYGFIQFLLQFRRRTGATHVAVALDESLFCGFRHDLCPNYKSNRELPDANLAMQLVACAELCAVFGLAAFGSKIYEADDIVGTIAKRVRAETANATAINIVTRDKDLAQLLVNPRDCVWDYSGNHKRYWQDIVRDFGVTPAQIPDFLGLTGDPVDRISGVPGVGPVKAKELLKQFSSMEGIYQNLDQVGTLTLRGAQRLQSQLAEFRASAELSKRLATIACDVQDQQEAFSQVGLADLRTTSISSQALRDFLSEYAFHQEDRDRILTSAAAISQS